MNTPILRETRKISIKNINKNYITLAEVNNYLKPHKDDANAVVKKKLKSPVQALHCSRMRKVETIHTDEIKFDEWYKENKYDIDLVFGSLLGIYTSKKVVFYSTTNELYSLFVRKYYKKLRK